VKPSSRARRRRVRPEPRTERAAPGWRPVTVPRAPPRSCGRLPCAAVAGPGGNPVARRGPSGGAHRERPWACGPDCYDTEAKALAACKEACVECVPSNAWNVGGGLVADLDGQVRRRLGPDGLVLPAPAAAVATARAGDRQSARSRRRFSADDRYRGLERSWRPATRRRRAPSARGAPTRPAPASWPQAWSSPTRCWRAISSKAAPAALYWKGVSACSRTHDQAVVGDLPRQFEERCPDSIWAMKTAAWST
jgi:hypothetical protein